jgi:hypothetical protein
MADFVVSEPTVVRRALIRTWLGAHAPLSPFSAYHQGHMTANADKAVRPTSSTGADTG